MRSHAAVRRGLLLLAGVCLVLGLFGAHGLVATDSSAGRTGIGRAAAGRHELVGTSGASRVDVVRHLLDHRSIRRTEPLAFDGPGVTLVVAALTVTTVLAAGGRTRSFVGRADLPARAPPLLAIR